MTRKRLWEAGAATALLLALAVCASVLLYLKQVNDAFAAALAQRDGEAAFALLRKGADVRAGMLPGRDEHVLFLAVRSGNPAFVNLVLDRGADVNTRRSDGHTALMAAQFGRHPKRDEIIRLLIRRGADVNATDAYGQTMLYGAVTRTNPKEAVDTLVSAGAKVDWQDKSGRTPLMCAAKVGDADAVQVLLDHGADPSLRNRAGNTALDIAMKPHPGRSSSSNTAEVIRLLKYGRPKALSR